MLAVAIQPVLQTSREFAVTTEMKQMNLAIENFQNKYGFYPPSFTGFNNGLDMEGQLLPFLNKISPNHRENTAMFLGTRSRLRVWWNGIGRHLDDRGSLVFWLTGLSTNKQFPITGGLTLVDINGNSLVAGSTFAQLPIIANADAVIAVDGMGVAQAGGSDREFDLVGTIERDSLFDFNGGQLTRDGARPGIRIYNSSFGNTKFDLAYRYRNAAFYDLPDPDPNDPSLPIAGRSLDAFYVSTVDANGMANQIFLNPGTFQLSTLGLDGRPSQFEQPDGSLKLFASSAINQPSTGTPEQRSGWQQFSSDNIANFANGRLDGFDWTEEVELGTDNPE